MLPSVRGHGAVMSVRVTVHRGTHQVGGVATEVRTDLGRVVIDMGDELSTEPDFVPADLDIDGVTNEKDRCDAVLLTHYHGDHTGQLARVREGVPVYMGALAKEVMLMSARRNPRTDPALLRRMEAARTFRAGEPLCFGDMRVTPYCIDHSAVDAYMFLVEAGGRRLLHTGDFRLHGIRRGAMPKVLSKLVRKADCVVTEGTAASRAAGPVQTERDLQERLKACLAERKYVLALCAATNLDRVFSLSRAVPRGRYCLADRYQCELVDKVCEHWAGLSPFYGRPKLSWISPRTLAGFEERGGLMFVRDNRPFRQLVSELDPAQSTMLYCMWDGYRTRPGSTIPSLLEMAGRWEPLHTSGHASVEDIAAVVEMVDPEVVVPMHTDAPQALAAALAGRNVALLQDGEELEI